MNSSTPSLDIVIVNWNTGEYLRRCLESVAKAGTEGFRLSRVVVVDNDSSDGSADSLDDLDLPLRVIRNDVNLGFAAACNQGAAAGNGDLLLFLNPDTEVFDDTLTTAVDFMEQPQADEVGIVGGRLVDAHGAPLDSCSRFPTLRLFVGKMTGLDRLAPHWFPPQPLSPAETATSRVVDQVIGAFLLIRRPLFAEAGGFDLRFFMYFEEVDLSLRLRQAGYRSYFLREARVFHAERVSSDQVPALRTFYALRSRTEFARKHWPRWQATLLAVLTLTVEPFSRFVAAAIHGRWAEVRPTVAATSLYGGYLLRGEHR